MGHSRSKSQSGQYDEINLCNLDIESFIDLVDVLPPNYAIITSYKTIQVLFKLINNTISGPYIFCGGIQSLVVSTSSCL
jgi:hypothetical protein